MSRAGRPLARYQAELDTGAYQADPHQRRAAEALDRLWQQLLEAGPVRRSWAARLRRRRAPRGLYLWGSVGRGKTWLMDLFFDGLPFEDKRRVHFHRFMQRVHDALRENAAERDPLASVAERWARDCRVLCFDEFHVGDIADAMLLGGLLDGLFANGVTLVATSNVAPGDLYRDGLQRARFLPAIERIKAHCEVLQLGGEVDYRLRILERAEIYHHPLDDAADANLQQAFERFAAGCELAPVLDVNGRTLRARRRGDGVAWFGFRELCLGPRSSADYIELARAFNTVLLSGVPVMDDTDNDAARRFVSLVDEFYDRNVKLLVAAEAPPDALYLGERLAFEFRRTASRLVEMQTHEYLARPHLP